ncbi:hypothetical protein NC651_017386 [Populus alba x Populus x berolinensis]|nr:hypothetical protein NC651_017386 [Populus alba x Populus x berolinensis]
MFQLNHPKLPLCACWVRWLVVTRQSSQLWA